MAVILNSYRGFTGAESNLTIHKNTAVLALKSAIIKQKPHAVKHEAVSKSPGGL